MLDIPLLITRPEVKEVAESVSKRTGTQVTGAHVILAWSQVNGGSVIPKSVTPSRIRDNFKEVELTAEEIAKVSALGAQRRRYNTPYAASMFPSGPSPIEKIPLTTTQTSPAGTLTSSARRRRRPPTTRLSCKCLDALLVG